MKRLWGIDITGSFVFTPGAAGVGTLQFVGQTLSLEQILVVTNVTRNEALYNFLDPTAGSAGFSNNVLTLDANTSTHSASDKIQAWVYVNGAQDVSTGELIESVEAMRMAVHSLTRTIGQAQTDIRNRLVVVPEQATAGNLQATATIASGTVTTVSTVTNQAQAGGIAMNDFIPTTTRLGGDSLRRNISVT